MWKGLFDQLLNSMMVRDRLLVRFPDGDSRHYGPDIGETVQIAFNDPATIRALCLNPELALGEAFMNGSLVLIDTRLDDLLRVLLRNRSAGDMPAWVVSSDRFRYHLRRIVQRNSPVRARANAAHHYDLSDELYRLFLDTDMQYSCAYFTEPKMTLEAAQEAKKAYIAAKLCLEPGQHVLDIGCGWGGLALTLARDHGVRVTGITLSENQLRAARTRAEVEGLEDRVQFLLEDYRDTQGIFDRVVSVGMLEHVGLPNLDTYFARVHDLLTPDGIALIHTIARSAPPMAHSAWMNKYIFPGGYVPSLSEIAGPMERAGLWQSDIEIWRLHYAKTLRHWRKRFEANADQLRDMYDDRFIAMFRYYFAICIAAFEHQAQAVYQFQLARKRDSVPLTRDYLYRRPLRATMQATSAE